MDYANNIGCREVIMDKYWIKSCGKCGGTVSMDSYDDISCMNCGVIYEYSEKTSWQTAQAREPGLSKTSRQLGTAYERTGSRGRPPGHTKYD